jgi:hypothetical protein
MPRWDIFDRDNTRESEPRPPQKERPQRSPETEPSVGRGPKDDSSPATHERSGRGSHGGGRGSTRRTRHPDRDRVYRLRPSEVTAMSDIGTFRTVDVQDLARFAYDGDEARMRQDVEHLRQEGLVEQKTVFRAHKTPRQMVTLTEPAHRLGRKLGGIPKEQKTYHGFVKPREFNHDADLYAVYQQAAGEIRDRGGVPGRVRLDFEMKAAVQREREAIKNLSEQEQGEHLKNFAEENGLTVRGETIHVPDVQLEYVTCEGELDRANLELVSENYRSDAIRGKAESGFRLYARGNDATRVRRALEDTRTVKRILSV